MNLDATDQGILSGIAWNSVTAAVRGGTFSPPDPGRPALRERRGCFVTIKTGGSLRGCIGCFTSDEPLYKTVANYAVLSVAEDPRFAGNRLRPDELGQADLEISALTPLVPCPEPEAITLGVDGIYVRSGGRSGCFLPQVAVETGWSVEEFWGHCCRDKAGLAWDVWRRPGTTCMTFTAEIFACPKRTD